MEIDKYKNGFYCIEPCPEIKQLKLENDELKERLKCNCFDSKSKQNRCTSYKRMAEDYERDLKELQQLKAEKEELKKRVDYCFEENSPNYDKFCDVCVAKDTCNGNCCYNQIKERLVYEI